MGEVNVLYLGMAYDIFSPVVLVSEFTTLFAIDGVDDAYGNWEKQKTVIRSILQNGKAFPEKISNYVRHRENESENSPQNLINSDYTGECSYMSTEWSPNVTSLFEENNRYNPKPCHGLLGPSEILSDEDDTENKVWRLKFQYAGKPRELVYYYDRDFYKTWPEDIQNISHVIWIGAYNYKSIVNKNRHNMYHSSGTRRPDVLKTMLETRTTPNVSYYETLYDFTEGVYNSYTRIHRASNDTESVGKKKFNFTSENWKQKWWEGGKQTRRSKRGSSKKRRGKKTRRN